MGKICHYYKSLPLFFFFSVIGKQVLLLDVGSQENAEAMISIGPEGRKNSIYNLSIYTFCFQNI